jgi:hypothetical protein
MPKHAIVGPMAKEKRPDDKLPKDEADRARDELAKRLGKTPPKPHKDEPPHAAVKRRDRP